MFTSECLNINAAGHLTIGGADTLELAGEFGTPVYVFDEVQIRKNMQSFTRSIDRFYGGNGRVLYAGKAFLCKEICRIAAEEGLGLDVVSGGELYTALAAGVNPSLLYMHGNNKTASELVMALENNVGHIVVDNLSELHVLNTLAASVGKTANILFRIKPGVEAHTHEFIRTGQIDSKFGFALETGEAMEAAKQTLTLKNVTFKGIHCHIGSQIFDCEPFVEAARVMTAFAGEIKRKTGIVIEELNLGGGFGIKYIQEDNPIEYERYMERVSAAVREEAKKQDIPLPFVLIEPGRSIIGAAGITLYTVGAVKEIPGIRTYVSVDGGMTDNPRYALYKARYDILNARCPGAPKDLLVTLAGRCCESGDLIGEDMYVQSLNVSDIVAVLSTGAYNYSMASNYNRLPKAAVVFVKDGKARLAVKRESYEDLLRNDI